ncbi:hypothetical protein K474DRAFT_1636771 [Panus rudis PR-1116 ss-1]|nr:hypothetical protein K474DRAFT_1636771 [Panus rudis PR-1116 ss-1]
MSSMESMLDEPVVLLDYPEVDQNSCQLLGPTALVVQGLMGVLVILSLMYKRHRESPKRPWRIWLFDVSKQVAGQLFVHFVNVLISGVVAHFSSGNACVFYFLNILIDTTLGVAIIYLILHVATFVLTDKFHLKGFESGKYGNPPSVNYWARQAAVYVFSLTTMKLLVITLFALWPGIFKMGEWLLSFLGHSDAAQVIFTMGIFPIIMNVLQFWLIDSIVKASAQNTTVVLPTDTPRSSADEDREPLFQAMSDDEDEDAQVIRPHDIENPPLHSRSLSRSRSRHSPEGKSSKLSPAASTGSITTTSTPKDPDLGNRGSAISLHPYPPVHDNSEESSPTSSSSHLSSSSSSKRRRRSPPPPLTLRPRSPLPQAVNATPHVNDANQTQTRPKVDDDHVAKDWTAWDDDAADGWEDGDGGNTSHRPPAGS